MSNEVNVSEAAQAALLATKNWHEGTLLAPCKTGELLELQDAGLVGPGGGLTRQGSIAAERLQRARLDAWF